MENESAVFGSTASDALDTLETRLRTLETYEILETFQGGIDDNVGASDAIGGIGDNSWSFIASGGVLRTFSRPNTAMDKFGRYTVSSGAGAISGFMLGSSGTPVQGNGLFVSQIESIEWSAAPDTTAGLNGKYRFGLGTNTALTVMGASGIFFEGDDQIGNDWRCIARRGGVQTTVTTSTPFQPPHGQYFKLGLFMQANGTCRFDINDVTVATLSPDALPLGRVMPACQVQATVNSGQAIEVDTCRLRYRRS